MEKMKIEKSKVEGTPRVAPPTQPAVIKVLALRNNLFLAQIEGFKGLLVYGISMGILNNSMGVSLKNTLCLESSILDFDFEPTSETLFILLKEDNSVKLDTFKIEVSKLVKDSTYIFSDLEDFLAPVADFEANNLENLHKRWFDNVKEYMEKKESRLEQMKRKDPPVKKQKVDNGDSEQVEN